MSVMDLPPLVETHDGTLADVLLRRAATMGDAIVYSYSAPRAAGVIDLSYAGLARRALGIAAELVDRGLSGRRALLLYPPGLEFIEAFYACMLANVSAMPMYVPARNLPDARLRAIADAVEVSAVLTSGAKAELVATVAAQLPSLAGSPIVATDAAAGADGIGWRAPDGFGEAPPLIQFTSGSTSTPKGVVVTHANIMANQRMIRRAFAHRGGETVISWLPFFHDMGLIGNIMQPLYVGGRAVLMSSADFLQTPAKWLQLISAFRADTSGAPNFAYDYCTNRVTDDQVDLLDLSSWKVAYNGSEMIRPATMRRFCARFARAGFDPRAVLHCYGMAETTLYASAGRGFPDGLPDAPPPPEAIASVGRPDPESRVRIAGPDGRALADGQVGEILIAGPHVAAGYLDDPRATAQAFAAVVDDDPGTPYLRTGDLGYLKGGELHVAGRCKNVLVVNGRNYHGEEIEYLGAGTDAMFLESGACVIQVDEGLAGGEIIFLQEIRKSSFERARHEIDSLGEKARAIGRRVLSEYSLPIHRVIYMRENRLPRTSSGKIDRGRVHEFAGHDASGVLTEVRIR